LTTLESLYTAKHPDVVKKRNQIEELEKRIARAPAPNNNPSAGTRPAAEPSQIQQLRASLRQDDINIVDLTKRQAQIQEQIRVLQGRVQASPMVEQQLKELTRSYQSALDFYNDLLRKRDQFSHGDEFSSPTGGRTISRAGPAESPANPSFPNKIKFIGGGLGAGLALGLGILYVLMASDQTLHTEKDVLDCLKLPVLTSIPILEYGNGSRSLPVPGAEPPWATES